MFSSDALQRRDTLAWSPLAGEHQSRGRVHTVDHRRRDQDRGAAFLCRLIDDVHGTQLQGRGMIGIDLGGLDKLPRDLSFGGPENDAGLFLTLGLGLARHGILQGHRDSDVADLDRGHRHAPSGGLVANLVPEVFVSSLPVRQEGCKHGRADHFTERGLRDTVDSLLERRIRWVSDVPENNCVDVDWHVCGDSLTGTVGVLTCCSYPSDSASVTPVLNPRHRSIGDGPLRKATELFCAGTSNCRIWCVASRHGSPAAFLDEGTPVPRRGNLLNATSFAAESVCCWNFSTQ